MPKCPKCGSENFYFEKYLDIKILKCSNCGFDESSLYDLVPQEKISQKAKGNYSPYKTGGSGRAKK